MLPFLLNRIVFVVTIVIFYFYNTNAAIKTGVISNSELITDVVNAGFVLCYDRDYSHATSTADLNECSAISAGFLFVGSISPSDLSKFHLGAYGLTSHVLASTDLDSHFLSNWVYWYRTATYSFGFSDTSSISQLAYDINIGDLKLSWHLDRGTGGIRSGSNVNLFDITWRKQIYTTGKL
jgi:hypothetical protein